MCVLCLNKSHSPNSESHILIEIEQLVKAIAEGNLRLSSKANRALEFNHFAGLFLESRARFLSPYCEEYAYSEHVELFWQGCHAVDFLGHGVLKTGARGLPPSVEQVEQLVHWLSEHAASRSFKRKVNDRRYEMRRKRENLSEYAMALHHRYSRLLVVRVDLFYKRALQDLRTIENVFGDVDSLVTEIVERKGIFENLVGYARNLEQGASLGYHAHLALYFRGWKHQSDWFLADEVGKRWVFHTSGHGNYHICNNTEEKQKYARQGSLGIGMIRRDDPEACANSIDAVCYLANPEKEGQYLRAKPHGRRAFATGAMPVSRQ